MVSEKHMSIVAAACFLISSKLLEADESCPRVQKLSGLHEWTSNDLCRMELCILEKLNWCVTPVSFWAFLPLFAHMHGIKEDLLCSGPMVTLAERSLSMNSTVLMRPAVLALALLLHVTGDMLLRPVMSQLLALCNIMESDLNQCKKNLTSLLSFNIFSLPPSSPSFKFPLKIFDKPSEIGTTCLPTIIEESA